jgi:hypothetical protein
MVQIIENPIMMTNEEIKAMYDGKWTYVVNCEFTPGRRLIRGRPVVVADMQFEDVASGIYDQYDAEEYGEKLSNSLLDTFGLIPSVRIG